VLPSVNLGNLEFYQNFLFFRTNGVFSPKTRQKPSKKFDFKAQGKSVQNIAFNALRDMLLENKKIKAFLRLLGSANRGPVRPRRRVEKKHFQELSLITGGYYGK